MCRFCTSHLSRFKVELPARLRGKEKQKTTNPTTKKPTKPNTKPQGQVCIDDVRSLPIDRDEGYATAEQSGQGPNYPAIIQCLLQFQTRIRGKDMIYLIVDNRDPGEVPHWPAFEKWWLSRCRLVGPHHENIDVLWITANLANELWDRHTRAHAGLPSCCTCL